jgi:glycosyltransferase
LKISIITVVYNAKNTIEETINSVISQSRFKDIEYVIVDGNSNDGTKEILATYSNYFGKYVSEKDNGIYYAMNKGLSIATGDIIGMVNSDDFYSDNTVIEKVLQAFETNPNTDIVYGDLVYIDQQNINNVIRKWRSKDYYSNFFEDGNVPPHPAFFFKRKLLEQNVQFNTNYRLAADYDFMFNLMKIKQCSTYYLPVNIVNMRLGGATSKNLHNRIAQNKEIYAIWKNTDQEVPRLFFMKKIFVRLSQFFFK